MQDADKTLQPWWELRFEVPAALADDISALLVDDGALGVQVQTFRQQLMEAWAVHPSMGPTQAAAGLGVDEGPPLGQENADEVRLVASYPHALAADEVLAQVGEVLALFDLGARLAGVTPERHHDTSWAHAWKQHFRPLQVGRRLWIVPTWETAFVPPAGSVVLSLDPGMAFGTGQHATTALCLRAIETLLDGGVALPTVLDVGCGSGVLGMAALALGAGHAVLTDVDAAAVTATERNLNDAGFAGRFVAQVPLPGPGPGFALVVANILAPVLCHLATDLVAQLAPGGHLLLSGILAEQADDVVAAVGQAGRAAGLPPMTVQRLARDAWVALLFVDGRPPAAA